MTTRSRHMYGAWATMIQRCVNPNVANYRRYGGRGITVCARWRRSFDAFLADMGERPAGMSLDRINNDKGYSPRNCRWATRDEQRLNSPNIHWLTFKGERMPLLHWARRLGLTRQTIASRLRYGWSVERTLSTSVAEGRAATHANSRRRARDPASGRWL